MRTKFLGVAAVLACCGLATGQTWNEVGDAGQDGIGAAQMPLGSGPLLQINGTVGGDNDVDLFGPFMIVDAANFMADTVGTVSFDDQLFVFDVGGMGVVHNDDFTGLDSRITEHGIPGNGIFYIAISAFNADPRDSNGVAIFTFDSFGGTQQRMPDPAAGALATWTTSSSTGDYSINFTGAEYVPAPGAISLLGLGGLIAMRRRRN